MKTTAAIVTLVLAASGLAAPAEKRQGQTSFTLCKQRRCLGDASQQISFDLQYGETGCRNFVDLGISGWNDAAFAAIANTGDTCFLHEAECNVQEGTTLTIKGRADDLGLLNGKASSVTCYKGDLKKRQQVDTALTLCKQRRCLGQPDQQLTVDLTFGQCYNFTPAFDNQVIAAKANGGVQCFLHEGVCDSETLGYRFEGQVDDFSTTIIGTTASSVTCYAK